MYKNIILTGSLSFDYIFDVKDLFSNYILPDKIHQINFSFVIDSHHKTWGGTAANQAFYFARLGGKPIILASGGYDFSEFRKFLEENNIITRFIPEDKKLPTGTGFVITDKKDNQIWMYSKGAMKNNSTLFLKSILSKIINPFLMISPNEPKAIIKLVEESVKYSIDFGFDPAFYIPTLPIETLGKGVKNAKIIFGNDYEIAFIEKRLKKSITSIVNKNQIVVKTLGDQGSAIYAHDVWTKVTIFKTKSVDPTGAGDAYRAGFIFGYLKNLPLKTCGWMGAVTASFAVEVKGTMNLKFSKKEFERRLRKLT